MQTVEKTPKISIGERLFRLVIVVSLFLTLLFTSIQAWIDYHKKTELVIKSIEQVELIQVKMISTALWSADKEQLQAQVTGILNFPYVNYVAITNQDNFVIDAGVKNNKGINKEIILTYDYNEKKLPIGRLLIQADTSKIFSEVLKNIIIIFFFQAATIFIAALMVFMLFERLVTRHLSAVAGHLKTYDINRADAPLHLNKKIRHDEIDVLTEAFNSMIEKLAKTYREQQLTLEELQNSRKQYRSLVEGTPDLITRVDTEGRFVFVNHSALEIYGLHPEECIGRAAFDFIHPEDRKATLNSFQYWLKKGGEIFTYENRQIGIDGREHHMTWSIIAEKDENGGLAGFASTARDITKQKLAEEEKAKLENQLLQSQKMESVGRLAGGVAHDFNNMLGVIIGHAEMALDQINPIHPIHEDLTEILNAAERSADLTRQLLAFARRQTIAPKVMDLNETVTGMLKMIQRLIGEDIHLTWRPATNLWQVKMDPSQIDQILANLCVNARDAISDVGHITIETRNSKFDAEDCTHYTDFQPGKYKMLAINDNGRGMDKETLAQIFEPFFTTKGVGEGTGLGLSTVYGIVKQNDGFINVYSEPGYGTTFKIYLPRHLSKTELPVKENAKIPVLGGKETILLVEDEPTFLRLTTKMLERQGYTVLAASTPGDAIIMAREHAGEISLLITDVIMPEMNGRDLAGRLLLLHPHLKYLFMSGYTADNIAHHGVLDEGVHFIQKPFSIQSLAAKTREVLDK